MEIMKEILLISFLVKRAIMVMGIIFLLPLIGRMILDRRWLRK